MNAVVETEERQKLRGWPAVLDWMARVRVGAVDAVAAGLELTPRQVHNHAVRLSEEGWLERPRVSDGRGGVLVVTPRGVREAGYEARSRSTPRSLTALLHGRGVSWLAAHSERRGRPWLGPLQLAGTDYAVALLPRRGKGASTHLPDLGVERDRDRWAVEYERVPKGRERLRRIFEGYRSAELAGQLEGVLYVYDSRVVKDLLERMASEVELTIGIQPLGEFLGELRGPPGRR